MAPPRNDQLFDDDGIRQIFDQVVDRRKVQFRDVVESVGLDSEQTRDKLGRLKDAHLIKERGAPLPDFSVFYVTAKGLETQRKLHRLDSLTSSLMACQF